jgi:hypothetical protein
VIGLALACSAPAAADVEVEMDNATLVIRQPLEQSANFFLERFVHDSRNGVRVRQTVPFDPAITSQDPDCDHNPVFNDVVCVPFPDEARIQGSTVADIILVGGGTGGDCGRTDELPVRVNAGPGDDIVQGDIPCRAVIQVADRGLIPRFLQMSGDLGNDTLRGASRNDVLFGDDGDDSLFGGGRNDTLEAGTGNDRLFGERGRDTLDGGFGPDVIAGGPGTDTVTYAGREGEVVVTLDGRANDGHPAINEPNRFQTLEGDNVTGVQRVIGGRGADGLIGGAGNDDLIGGRGNDTLAGGDGDDRLTGDEGVDSFFGGPGNDRIFSRDGVAEDVNCGPGIDFNPVTIDLVDRATSCLQFLRFAVDDGPPGRIVGRSVAIRRNGSLSLRLRCPRSARVPCRGRLRLAAGGRRLESDRYRVPLGRTRVLRLRLTRREAARARSRGRVVATTRERGVSRKGPRSTRVVLTVRRG